MPLEWVVMRWAAQNRVVRGNLVRCIAVPAVTEVCRPQSRHSYKRGRLFNVAKRRLPQAGQMKPSGQRRLNMKRRTSPRQRRPSGTGQANGRRPSKGVRVAARLPPLKTLYVGQPESTG